MPVDKADGIEIIIKNLPWKISFIAAMVFTIPRPWSTFKSLFILGKKYKIFNFGNSAGMAFCYNLWVNNASANRFLNF